MQTLHEFSLGYLKLGQSLSTISGGETQHMKLASFLLKHHIEKKLILFILDEPSRGLHFHDIKIPLKGS